MNNDKKDLYAYNLIGLMKESLNKKGDDGFWLFDFNFIKLNIKRDDAMSTLSVKAFQDILIYIMLCNEDFIKNSGKGYATYHDMRNYFKLGVQRNYEQLFKKHN